MRRSLHIIALVFAAALIASVSLLSSHLPGQTQPLIEKKYSNWSGVLRGWISSRWSCDGSFLSWLNRCAAEFEKDHPGVYIEFSQVSEPVLGKFAETGLRRPEMLFFSPGTLHNDDLLDDVYAEVRDGLLCLKAVPVAMGGYIYVYNTSHPRNSQLFHLPDDTGRCFSLATTALACALADEDKQAETDSPSGYAIDLGLPAGYFSADGDCEALPLMMEANLERFISGEISSLVVSQKELQKIADLRDAGKGPDWACAAPGEYMLADQLLLAGLVQQMDSAATETQDDTDSLARMKLARAFIEFLSGPECQEKLRDIGAFTASGAAIYPPGTPFGGMEATLEAAELIVPDYFSEYPCEAFGGIVRKFASGELSADESIRLLLTESTF